MYVIVNKANASVLQRRNNEVYVHYASSDNRLDEWRLESDLTEVMNGTTSPSTVAGRKRQRISSIDATPSNAPTTSAYSLDDGEEPRVVEENQEAQKPAKRAVKRNFDKVNFGHWQIKTWYVPRHGGPNVSVLLNYFI